VKVKKNPRSVDSSALASSEALSLNNPAEFLKNSMVKEALIKLVAANKDKWIKSFRNGVRYYRSALIAQALDGKGIDNSFYDSMTCQTFDLLKFKKEYRIIEMIAHTALLAGVAEIGHKELSSDLKGDSNVAAIFELIKVELGVKIEKITDETGFNGVSIQLVDIPNEDDSLSEEEKALKALDSVQVLKLQVKRDVNDKTIGNVEIKASVGLTEGQEALGSFRIERDVVDGVSIVQTHAEFGLAGFPALVERTVRIETVKDNDKKLIITDMISKGETQVSTVSLDGTEVKWCKAGAEEQPKPIEECLLKENCPEPTMSPVVNPTPAPSNQPGQNNPSQKGGKA